MIRKLMQSIREFKLFSLLSPLFVVLEVVMEVVIPILMAKLIDDGIDGSGGMDAVMHYGWILLVCCVLSLIFGALAGHFAAFASAHRFYGVFLLRPVLRSRFFSLSLLLSAF